MPSDRRSLEDAFLNRAAFKGTDGSEERKEITALDSFREWLSDNLRYLMLIAAILIVLAALFFGVRAMTRSLDGESGKAAGDRPVTESTVSAESRAKQDSQSKAADVSEPSSAEKKDDSSAAAEESKKAAEESKKAAEESKKAAEESRKAAEESKAAAAEKSREDASNLVTGYFSAVGRQDLDSVLSMVDSLTEEEKASVRDDRTAYSNVKVLLRDGVRGNGEDYIAFVSYDYKNETQYVTHYGLSWLYLKRNANGALKIMVQGASDGQVTGLADSLMQDGEIAEMIASVQEKAASADAEEKAKAS